MIDYESLNSEELKVINNGIGRDEILEFSFLLESGSVSLSEGLQIMFTETPQNVVLSVDPR